MPDLWQEYLEWKAGPGSQFEDPMFEFLKDRDMYPSDYVKDLAQKIIRDGLKLPLSRWLWLRFKYNMLVNPLRPSVLHPFNRVSYDRLWGGTYVEDRGKLSTTIRLWLTLIGFRMYTKLPWTYYQKWKRHEEAEHRHSEEMRKKLFQRPSRN